MLRVSKPSEKCLSSDRPHSTYMMYLEVVAPDHFAWSQLLVPFTSAGSAEAIEH